MKQYNLTFEKVANPGLALIRDIEFRAKHASMDSVLLVSKVRRGVYRIQIMPLWIVFSLLVRKGGGCIEYRAKHASVDT